MHGVAISFGSPWPPNSTSCCTPCQPASANCRNASLKPRLVVTTPSFHVDGATSPPRFSGATTSCTNFAFSSSTACAVSRVASSKPGIAAIASSPASSSMTNSMSFSGAV